MVYPNIKTLAGKAAETRQTLLLLGFILLKFILQYSLISPEYDLQRDEYLHLDQASHLAWGYLSVPPFTSWLSWIIRQLGNSVFWVKFFPALFGAMTIGVVWKTIQALNGNTFALVLGATCVLFSVLLRLNTLYQPNSLDVLCWTSLYFIVLKCIQTQRLSWFLAGGVVFAVGFLNKYNIGFLLAGLIPALLLTRQRSLLFTRKALLACLVGALLVLPNLLWQYNNGFPVIHHMNQLAAYQLVNVDRWAFLRAQFFFFAGSSFVIGMALYALLVYPPFRPYRSFFWAFFGTLVVFLYFRAKDYYAIGLYPIYLAFGSVFIANKVQTGRLRYLQPVCLLIPIVFFGFMYQFAFPNRSPAYIVAHSRMYQQLGMLRWEDGKDHPLPQDYADMLGWQELAAKVDQLYAKLPEPDRTLVLCDNYGQAGAINYYTKQGIRAVSFNADYVNWFDLDTYYTNLIRVKEAGEVGEELRETSPFFRTALVGGNIQNPWAREQGTTIFVFTGAKVDIRRRINAEINQITQPH
ncbi:glycosyl transferase [Fibrisoma montanum]|uniref:Glycosyl transferase n=1 Tax=Fibrisoma montanum TaxID=2305895 RepID=A0A418MC67_9BACT|nr:glycosyltransferase family 39 protein [Fibrisoma montanum]RIV23930.1 glycosyl transferase [Fibrisoma montanum]